MTETGEQRPPQRGTMSLRPEISGFDLPKMTRFIGCADPAVAARAEAHARAMYDRAGAEHVEAVVARLRQVILGELKPGGIDAEEPALISAIIALSWFEQDHLETGSNMWKSVHLDWALDLPKELDGADQAAWDDARTLAEYAVLQRPLFGSHQDSDWTTYGYLSRDEVQRLLDHRQRFPRLGEDAYGFARDFFGWLGKIAAAGRDYWFYAK